MERIAEIIPQQGFEIVRDAIGAVLALELKNQKKLQGLSEPFNVFNARSTPFHQSEILMVNVLLDSANYSNAHAVGVHGTTSFFIDIYSSAKEDVKNLGDLNSTVRRDKYLGMVRYILQHHKYNMLGLPVGCIMNTTVESFENFEPSNAQDASFVKMSRLVFTTRINEQQSLWDGVEINSIFTNVKLELTDRGYQYITE